MPPSRRAGPGYVRVGSTVLPRWLPWLVAALVVVGGGTAGVLIAVAPEPAERTADGALSGLPSGAGGGSATPSDVVPPSTPASARPTPSSTPSVEHTPPVQPPAEASPPRPDDPGDVVEEYYQDLVNRDFAAAWELGGRNIAHTSYAKWVAGYDTTASISLGSANTVDAGRVRVLIRALQTDGTLRMYEGTYTVSGGVIVGAEVTER
ncbi:hypothetical protein K7B10_03775 [Streptomyces flavotricini]|uniref:Integral membrane protein n=1 Tax=Streptomyces flavotricini TaxID=66888 RepID=A0ABS8DYH1_9ACTN|nr:hypothetical protein [Streptomyces flavotricini]MCC0093921.1 hypothetical protein [Streptomyces flavotricini]